VVFRARTRCGHVSSELAMLLAASWAKEDFSPSDFDSGRLGNYLGAETRIGMAVAKRRGLRRAITAVAQCRQARRKPIGTETLSQTEQGCRSLDAASD
jgi:hypothetical protein